MEYIACLRVGQNDIKALINIEPERRRIFSPLLNMRGDDDRYIRTFLENWADHKFFLDISRATSDVSEGFISNNDLHNPNEGFKNKRRFFDTVFEKNKNAIPVISWVDTDPQRDVIQCTLSAAKKFGEIAVRVFCQSQPSKSSWQRTKAIMDAIADPGSTHIILDFGASQPTPYSFGSPFHNALSELDQYGPKAICLLSSSFPADKPASNTSRQVPCMDIVWQTTARALPIRTPIVYGDYAAMSPAATMEYVPGMPVLPFANYYTPVEWWQKRQGKDKEFANYIDLAREIRTLPGYHGDDFCWATKEFSRISNSGASYGNNGVWNGYRINQHICAMLDHLTSTQGEDEVDIDDYL